MTEADPGLESGTADRLLFFSDAVVAIAMTLLALELPVPVGKTANALWASARAASGHYLAFLVSFVVIAIAWGQHHHVMRYLARSDSRLRTLNMCWLFTIVLIPFSTKLLTTEGGHDTDGAQGLRFGFYALLQIAAGLAFLAILHHMVKRQLQSSDMPAQIVTDAYWNRAAVIFEFALSIPMFFFVTWGWVAWIVGPLAVGQVVRGRRRRRLRA